MPGAQPFSRPQERKTTFHLSAVQAPLGKQQLKGLWGTCRLCGKQEMGEKWGCVTVVSKNFPKLRTGGEEKEQEAPLCHMSYGTAFFHLCLPRANFWLQGKVGLCWTDNQQQTKVTGTTVSYQVPQPCQEIGGEAPSLNMAQQVPSSFFSTWRYSSSESPALKHGILSLGGGTCCPLKCNGTAKAQCQLTDSSQTASNRAMLPGWKALMASKGPLSQRQSQGNGFIRQSFFRPCAN